MLDLWGGELSKRQIAARYRIGTETIDAIRNLMEERAELRTLQQTITNGLQDCIVLMTLQLREALLAGKFSTAQMPIALCALIDKKGQLDAGIVPGTQRTEAEAWESQVDVAWRALQRAKAMANGVPTGPTIDISEPVPEGAGGSPIATPPKTEMGPPSENPGPKDLQIQRAFASD